MRRRARRIWLAGVGRLASAGWRRPAGA